jgi:hypothetical protein
MAAQLSEQILTESRIVGDDQNIRQVDHKAGIPPKLICNKAEHSKFRPDQGEGNKGDAPAML